MANQKIKIGILTHHYIKNYGAFLQTYALQQYLTETYPDADVKIIDYVNQKHKWINIAGCFRFFKGKENLRAYLEKIKLPKTFAKEEKKYLHLTKRVRSSKEINALGLDLILVGSDEVWHYQDKAYAPVKFGYGLQAKGIASYAPSCGGVDTTKPIPAAVQEGMQRFTHFSARDDIAEWLVQTTVGKKAVRVLDPTLLYDFPIYEDSFTEKLKKKPYMLMYFCEKLAAEGHQQLIDYAKKKGWEIYGAGEYAKYYSDITTNLTPFQWVEMFRNAQLVVTGTFHGVVFSLISKRNFAAYLTNPSRVKKVHSLLEQFGLSNRIFTEKQIGQMQDLFAQDIDYGNFGEQMGKIRETSYSYLSDVIATVQEDKKA